MKQPTYIRFRAEAERRAEREAYERHINTCWVWVIAILLGSIIVSLL